MNDHTVGSATKAIGSPTYLSYVVTFSTINKEGIASMKTTVVGYLFNVSVN
jgi:hypothetical protein